MKPAFYSGAATLWLIVLPGLLLQTCAARVVNATNGRGIVQGFIDPDVTTVVVVNDLAWNDADWAGVETPMPLTRSLTITGLPPGPDGVLFTWDSNYVTKKVRLVNVTLTLQNFAIYRYRRVNQNLAPGCDLLEVCAVGDWGRVVLVNSFLVQRLCYPASMHPTALAGVMRPRAIPGNQTYRAMLPQPACQAPPAAVAALPSFLPRPQQKCWPYMGAYDDLGIFCADLDASQKQVLTGYTLHCLQVTYVCDDIITDECVARLGTVGCYNNWAAYKQQLTSQPPGATGSVLAPLSAASSSGEMNTGAIVGGVVGGVCGAILLGVAVVAFLWHERRRRQEQQQRILTERSGDDGGKGPSSVCLVADGGHGASTGGIAAGECGPGADASSAAQRAAGVSCWPWCAGRAGAARLQEASAAHTADGGHLGDLEYGAPGAVALVRDSSSRMALGGGKAALVDADVHEPAAGGAICSCADSKSAAAAAPPSAGSDLNASARRDSRLHHHLLHPHSSSNGGCSGGHGSGQRDPQAALAGGMLEHTLATSAYNTATATATTLTGGGGSSNADGGEGEAATTLEEALASTALGVTLPSPVLLSTMAGMDTMEVVTLDTPQMVTVSADPCVSLLPVVLGRGAFGRVVVGRYQGQRVAVKILNEMMATDQEADGAALVNPDCHDDANDAAAQQAEWVAPGGEDGNEPAAATGPVGGSQLDALVQEVEVLGRCRHPNVVRLLAACLTPPRLCLVMELMETSLERMLYGGGPEQPLLPLGTVMDIALDVAQGLSYLHPTIVHRDLKPGNVLVNLNGGKRPLAKLSDFGLSRIQSTVVITADLEAGTPGYMAPELFDVSNFVISHKVDIYSYGVLLWAMLTGKEPWKEYGLVQMTYCVAILQQRPPLPGPDRCSDKMRRLIASCWEPQPQRRPAAAEVVKQLLLIKQQHETLALTNPLNA
ncbi:hypothetical protein HYH02_003628 [Chlamydomonas schloesseri]|uniref:Protein kinase domain-containing protein n=1 Tax=Chlamydomonas schloesseri TaxID=2026947 RepID=A0A836B9K5_9CHLO|nr:hypothetical protein HYH02_003628 [Chlamydomonas schloesseri]|eukprot:KAG2451852.1 hypothetical protein HYH02_003628 [Chlamydomonas schloesseri]